MGGTVRCLDMQSGWGDPPLGDLPENGKLVYICCWWGVSPPALHFLGGETSTKAHGPLLSQLLITELPKSDQLTSISGF